MKARVIAFGVIEIEAQRYEHDVVIEKGKVTKRKKGPSKPLRDRYGHTPLSAEEKIPWGGDRLIVGTGVHGQLPVTEDLLEEARQRGIDVVSVKTDEACALLRAAAENAVQFQERFLQWRIHAALGRLLATMGKPDEAQQQFARAQFLIESLTASLPDTSLKGSFHQGASEVMRTKSSLPTID